MQKGTVEGIFIASVGGQLPVPVDRAKAVPGLGLEGDRYHAGTGTFSDKGRGNGRDLTLIETEALIALLEQDRVVLSAAESRRNLLTRGVALNDLLGKRFKIGDVLCEGMRLCDPCDHLEKVTKEGVLRGLVDRGGLRADILEGGEIRTGDELVELA